MFAPGKISVILCILCLGMLGGDGGQLGCQPLCNTDGRDHTTLSAYLGRLLLLQYCVFQTALY